jgi:hypothetical protein
MSKRYKHIGWEVIQTTNNKYSLFYEPGVIGETGALIEISSEVFEEASKEGVSLKNLFDKYSLENNKVLLKTGTPVKLEKAKSTSDKFYGRGFIATQEENKYFLEYQLARHGGGSRKFEITKEIYEDARQGDKSTSDLFKKYNLYHLDLPENDVK